MQLAEATRAEPVKQLPRISMRACQLWPSLALQQRWSSRCFPVLSAVCLTPGMKIRAGPPEDRRRYKRASSNFSYAACM